MKVRAEEPKQGEKEQAGKDKDPVNKGGNAYIDELPVSVEVACYKTVVTHCYSKDHTRNAVSYSFDQAS